MTTGRYPAAKSGWPLCGDEFVARMGSPRPVAAVRQSDALLAGIVSGADVRRPDASVLQCEIRPRRTLLASNASEAIRNFGAARDKVRVRMRALCARKFGTFLDADVAIRIRPKIPIDDFLNLATAESSLGARVVVRETLHFKLERRSTLQNAVTSLLKRRSQPAV
ncbi:hypothetical protein [Caballeronia temeraria]|uniref:hypothetical protein n=1 Tax=Caballeronia temeraria TaxID=1777137 RepID=UPI0012FDCE8E|nr:hypothetical protein [Caballeronia temeraria]